MSICKYKTLAFGPLQQSSQRQEGLGVWLSLTLAFGVWFISQKASMSVLLALALALDHHVTIPSQKPKAKST